MCSLILECGMVDESGRLRHHRRRRTRNQAAVQVVSGGLGIAVQTSACHLAGQPQPMFATWSG